MQTTVTTPPATPPTTSRFDNSLPAVALVAVGLVLVVGMVFMLWRRLDSGTATTTMDRYFPSLNGAALAYRVINPDGSIRYRSRNIARGSANKLFYPQSSYAFGAMMAAANIPIETDPATAVAQLSQINGVLLRDVESDAQGKVNTETKSRALILDNTFAQFSVNDIGITPPIPLFPASDGVQTLEGTLNDQIPYRLSQQIDQRGAHTTAVGEFPDCVRVNSQLTINDSVTQNLTWYCADVGEVSDEYTDSSGTRRTEIIAANIGVFLRGSMPILPNPDVNAALSYNFPEPLQGTLIRLLEYKESNSAGISTPILPVDSLLLYGTASGALVAFDRATEQEVWRFQTGGVIFSTPVVANGIAYFGSADKQVHAVRLSDGAFVWAYPTKDIVSAAPAVGNNTVYFASEDRNLYALDADTGRRRWTFTTGSPFIAAPVVYENMVIVSNNKGALYALDQATGSLVWDFAASGAITAPVVIVNGVVYVGSYDQTVYALNAADGRPLWSQFVGGFVSQPVLVADARVYVQLNAEVFALDAATGKRLWRYNNNAIPLLGAPLRFGNQIWILQTGNLLALDAATGVVIHEVPTDIESTYTGSSSNGRELYLGSFAGQVYGLIGSNR